MDNIIADFEFLEILERNPPYFPFPVSFMCMQFAEDVGFGIEVKIAKNKTGMQVERNPACFKPAGAFRIRNFLSKKIGQLRDFPA